MRKARTGSSHDALIAFMANRLPGEISMPAVQRELGLIAKIIRVNEILARVVWRVDVDELHLSRVTLS